LLNEQAVLFRTGHHSGALEIELARRNIPFVKFGGLKFLEVAHVKDLVALLRFAENPRDEIAGFRVLQLLPGIGPRTARRALQAVCAAATPLVELAGFEAPARARRAWGELARLLRRLGDPKNPWDGQIGQIRLWYEPYLEELYEAAPARKGDLEELEAIAGTFESREHFLSDITLDPPAATGDLAGPPLLDEDYLILSTIHSAKGQEWRIVYILHVVDGCIPSDMACGSSEEIEEERRLLYVAMTRARDELHLIHPKRFYTHGQARRGDRHVYAPRSRFIPEGIVGLFEPGPSATSPRGDGTTATDPTPPATIDIAAHMREMWR
jgi:DNA helicase-2/ATP-dependent DNA helicase PcrA